MPRLMLPKPLPPHRVLYLIDGERIVVFAVISHRRDDPAWRDRLD